MNARAARLWSEQLLFRGLSRSSASQQPAPTLRSFFTSSQPSAKSRALPRSLEHSTLVLPRSKNAPLFRRFRSLRFKSDKTSNQNPNPTPHLGSPEPAPSLSQRLKKLSREYGWAALGVYMALTVLDFPFCFLAVRALGTERIGHYEHVVVEAFWSVVRIPFPNLGKQKAEAEGGTIAEDIVEATAREGDLELSNELHKTGAKPNGADASIWTQLALAYVVHKSFIFVRIPLTAAILPKVVKTLRGWGWNIGKRTPKSK